MMDGDAVEVPGLSDCDSPQRSSSPAPSGCPLSVSHLSPWTRARRNDVETHRGTDRSCTPSTERPSPL